jgi:hypothetical protein
MVWVVPLSVAKLIPRALTPEIDVSGIQSLKGFGNLVGSLAQSVLYPRHTMTRGKT